MKVLVVDDEGLIRRLVSEFLFKSGHCVAEASCGQDAVDLNVLFDADVLVTDMNMPGMSGLELLETLRVPSIVISGFISDDVSDALMGKAKVLEKPFDFDELLGLVNSIGKKLCAQGT